MWRVSRTRLVLFEHLVFYCTKPWTYIILLDLKHHKVGFNLFMYLWENGSIEKLSKLPDLTEQKRAGTWTVIFFLCKNLWEISFYRYWLIKKFFIIDHWLMGRPYNNNQHTLHVYRCIYILDVIWYIFKEHSLLWCVIHITFDSWCVCKELYD